jgi:hypothetical protein
LKIRIYLRLFFYYIDAINKDVSPNLENALNAMGKEGWELVNSIAPASGFGKSEKLVLIFSRTQE